MVNKYINDIYNLVSILEEKHLDCYFDSSREEMEKYIFEVLSKYKLEDDIDFYYVGNLIIKKLFNKYDSHTKLIFKNSNSNFPIRLKYIDGKLYIVKTDIQNENLKYSQILKINDININKLIKEVEMIIPYSTKGFLEMQIESTFYNSLKIKSLPSFDNSTKTFKYTIIKDNKEQDVFLEINDINFNENNNYTFDILDEIMVIHYTSCVENYENQMAHFVEKIKEESEKNNIEKYIMDIRGNVGGNSEIIKPLLLYLCDKKIITLVDKYVFSGGRFALIDLINIGSKTVGTGIGTSINCFGNISRYEIGNFILPISNKYFYYKDGRICNINRKDDFLKFKKNSENRNYFIPIIFSPDYIIENKIEDYKNNRDRVLEYAVKILTEEKNHNYLIN